MKKLITIAFLGFGLTAFAQDSTNTFDYNYKKGMEHYNRGVDQINKVYTGQEPINFDSLHAETLAHFKTALPFLLKAYSLNSKNEKVVTALQGSYFSMQDFKNSDKYKKELEALKK